VADLQESTGDHLAAWCVICMKGFELAPEHKWTEPVALPDGCVAHYGCWHRADEPRIRAHGGNR
jgi:hypothetical protein